MTVTLIELMQDSSLRKAFGQRIKQLRKQQSWTQKQLAAKLDIRFSQLNKYECGLHIPPAEKLIQLAEIFNTTTDFLLTGNASEEAPLHNLRLLERFKALEQVNSEEQEAVIKLIDAVVVKARAEGLLRPLDRQQ